MKASMTRKTKWLLITIAGAIIGWMIVHYFLEPVSEHIEGE